jgi:hypothetical protein
LSGLLGKPLALHFLSAPLFIGRHALGLVALRGGARVGCLDDSALRAGSL